MPSVIFCSYVPAAMPRSGEQVRVNALWRALAGLGAKLHIFTPDMPGGDQAPPRRDVVIHHAALPWPQMSRNPWDYWRVDRQLLRRIAEIAKREAIQAAIFDYGFLGQYIEPCQDLGLPVIIGTHNAQAQLIRQLPPRSIGHRALLDLTHRTEYWHERRFFPRADAVLCVSEPDRHYHTGFVAEDKIHVIPNFIAAPADYPAMPRDRRLIMTASFTNFQNLEGARWFLQEIWDGDLARHVSFCLAGKGSAEALSALGSFPNVSALGERADLQREIAGSLCAIVPILHASGTRLKCIEALALRTPLLSTSRGAEGLDHRGAMAIADTPAAFRAELWRIIREPAYGASLAEAGHALYEREYSLTVNQARLRHVLQTVGRSSVHPFP